LYGFNNFGGQILYIEFYFDEPGRAVNNIQRLFFVARDCILLRLQLQNLRRRGVHHLFCDVWAIVVHADYFVLVLTATFNIVNQVLIAHHMELSGFFFKELLFYGVQLFQVCRVCKRVNFDVVVKLDHYLDQKVGIIHSLFKE